MTFLKPEEWTTFKSACLENGVLIERVIKSFYRRILPANATALDVGAHVGYHTSGLAEKLTDGLVVACEANPNTYLALLRSLSKIPTTTPVLTINAAIQENEETKNITFNVSKEFPGRSGINKLWKSIDYTECTVTAYTVDGIFEGLGLEALDFFKCDVEGTEFEVFLGAENTLNTHKPVCVMEHSERSEDGYTSDWLSYFSRLGYVAVFPNGDKITEESFYDFWYVFLLPESKEVEYLKHLKEAVSSWKTL